MKTRTASRSMRVAREINIHSGPYIYTSRITRISRTQFISIDDPRPAQVHDVKLALRPPKSHHLLEPRPLTQIIEPSRSHVQAMERHGRRGNRRALHPAPSHRLSPRLIDPNPSKRSNEMRRAMLRQCSNSVTPKASLPFALTPQTYVQNLAIPKARM